MPASNVRIAALFRQMADLLAIRSANPFRIRAYRNAARSIESWPESLALRVQEEGMEQGRPFPKIPGVGDDLSEKVHEISQSGSFEALEELLAELPSGLLELLQLPGLGPKRVAQLHEKLKISGLAGLVDAIEGGALSNLRGFGEKRVSALKKAIEAHRSRPERRLLISDAESISLQLLRQLNATPGVRHAEIAGSLRRGRETIGDIDLLASCRRSDAPAIVRSFVGLDGVQEVLAQGDTKCSVRLQGGTQVDLRLVRPRSFGAALHYFTGSKAHNVAIRRMAARRGLRINEYGIFKDGRRLGGRDEQDVFDSLGLSWIPPELRENTGEIEASGRNALPRLVEFGDLRGDLHAHTRASDGRASLREMAEAARLRGYDYLAITDHSPRMGMAHGLDARRLRRQMGEIDRLNEELAPFRLLKGCEVDILKDGRLDLPDEVLMELDLTVCSIHSHFDLPASQQLDRIRRAMDHPCFTIWGHPTGRRMGERTSRPPISVDLQKALEHAAQTQCFVELNSQPERLDLSVEGCRLAASLGIPIVISTDAHEPGQLDFIRFGLGQARRAWLEPEHIVNTDTFSQLEARLRERRQLMNFRPARRAVG